MKKTIIVMAVMFSVLFAGNQNIKFSIFVDQEVIKSGEILSGVISISNLKNVSQATEICTYLRTKNKKILTGCFPYTILPSFSQMNYSFHRILSMKRKTLAYLSVETRKGRIVAKSHKFYIIPQRRRQK